MRAIRRTGLAVGIGVAALAVSTTDPAHATCRTWEATHNGTNMFYASGSRGTAANKLLWQVEQWQQAKGVKKVRVGKISTTCGDWFMKYMLPHKHCKARARVCY